MCRIIVDVRIELMYEVRPTRPKKNLKPNGVWVWIGTRPRKHRGRNWVKARDTTHKMSRENRLANAPTHRHVKIRIHCGLVGPEPRTSALQEQYKFSLRRGRDGEMVVVRAGKTRDKAVRRELAARLIHFRDPFEEVYLPKRKIQGLRYRFEPKPMRYPTHRSWLPGSLEWSYYTARVKALGNESRKNQRSSRLRQMCIVARSNRDTRIERARVFLNVSHHHQRPPTTLRSVPVNVAPNNKTLSPRHAIPYEPALCPSEWPIVHQQDKTTSWAVTACVFRKYSSEEFHSTVIR
ncbi:hypothetical protein DFH08DRAFT_817837 [Mycena albidolilacea]|uniref:Uncharacterized protein n=1 Tax=Mycena albidolilacea TaxID=1033008 RepID=A0AAD6ZHT2_9AGAR|nr:hypothetical protein DFH08DRAFT_817837 [Mycena albidolilacea]